MADQLARGIYSNFAADENPFTVPNGMEDNLRTIDDHLGLYTLNAPVAPGTAYPIAPAAGDGQLYNDGSYAVFNGQSWRNYPSRPGILARSKDGLDLWLSTALGGWSSVRVSAAEYQAGAQLAQAQAEAARDAALAASRVYADTAEGVGATNGSGATDRYFVVPGVGNDALRLYLNDEGVAILKAVFPTVAGIATRVEQQTKLIRADRVHSFGPSTPATGSNASQLTYIIAGRSLPAGLIDTIKIYAGGAGTVKVKRFTRAGDTYTFVSEFTLTVVAGLNTFAWGDGSLAHQEVNDGEYLGFYPSSGTLMIFNSVTAPSGTEYHTVAGDNTTTYSPSLGTVPSDTTRLEVYVAIRLADASTDAMVAAERSDWGGSFYLGARTPAAPVSPQYLGVNLISYEDHVFQQTSRLQTITVYAAVACVMKVFVLSPSAGRFTLLRAFTIALAVGSNTKTAGVDFPADVIVPQGGMIGHRALKTTSIPATVFITRRYRTASVEPSATVTTFDQGTSSGQTHQIRYDFVTQQAVRPIVDRKQYLLDEDFADAAISLDFTATNWTQGSGVATSASTGLANPLEWRAASPYFSRSKHRVKFTFDDAGSSVLVYRRVNSAQTLGTIFEIDMAGDTLRLYAAWSGGTPLPSVLTSKVCGFSFATGNAYIAEVEKDYKTLTLTITDAVTGATDSLSYDADTLGLGGGLLLGAPGVAAKAGTVSVHRFSYLSSVKDPKVICFGDSITEGTGATIPNTWAYMVAENAGGLTSAHSGEGVSGILQRAERELRLFSPKYAIVLIGTNDTNMTTWQDGIGFIAEKCLNAGVTPVFGTLPPEAADTNPVLVQNPYIRASGYRYIDFARALTTGGNGSSRDASKFFDALHPNTAGHLAMYQRVRLDLPEIFD